MVNLNFELIKPFFFLEEEEEGNNNILIRKDRTRPILEAEKIGLPKPEPTVITLKSHKGSTPCLARVCHSSSNLTLRYS